MTAQVHIDSLQSFRSHLEQLNRAPATVSGSVGNVRPFLAYLDDTSISLESLSLQDVEGYAAQLISLGTYSDFTIASKLGAVRAFCRFAYSSGFMKNDFAHLIHVPAARYTLPRAILTRREINRLLKAPKTSTDKGIRDKAILETFYSTGIRLSELLNLTVNDVDTTNGILRVIRGKGKKDRTVPLGRIASRWIECYLSRVRRKLITRNPHETHLFVGMQSGKRIDGGGMRRFIKRYAEKARVLTPVSPHVLRHSFASHLLASGADSRYIQEFLGHAFLETTQIYTRVTQSDVRKMHTKHHPREKDEY